VLFDCPKLARRRLETLDARRRMHIASNLWETAWWVTARGQEVRFDPSPRPPEASRSGVLSWLPIEGLL
jgi:hypothetical protein